MIYLFLFSVVFFLFYFFFHCYGFWVWTWRLRCWGHWHPTPWCLISVRSPSALCYRTGASIPSSPPGWRAGLPACGWKARLWAEPEPRPPGEEGARWVATPWWRWAGCRRRRHSDPRPRACGENKETGRGEVIVRPGSHFNLFSITIMRDRVKRGRGEERKTGNGKSVLNMKRSHPSPVLDPGAS